MGIGKKMVKGMIGGGVDISHKSKLSGQAKSLESYPGGMPGPGDYGKIVGKGMAQYLSGESVGMKKYGKPKGPMQAKPDYIDIDGDGDKKESMKQASDGMGKYGKHEGPAKVGIGSIKKDKPKDVGSLNYTKKDFSKGLGGDLKSKKVDLVSKSSDSNSKSSSEKTDMQKIKASKKKKIEDGKAKKAEVQSDLKKARETKFISRGSGEDSGVETREGRRKKIRAARSKKREGRRAERKARKGTVIKQKNVRQRKADD
jgi:hypothetical protein